MTSCLTYKPKRKEIEFAKDRNSDVAVTCVFLYTKCTGVNTYSIRTKFLAKSFLYNKKSVQAGNKFHIFLSKDVFADALFAQNTFCVPLYYFSTLLQECKYCKIKFQVFPNKVIVDKSSFA